MDIQKKHLYMRKNCNVDEMLKKFYIGVRFNPESLYKVNENMNKIFEKFIKIYKNLSLK